MIVALWVCVCIYDGSHRQHAHTQPQPTGTNNARHGIWYARRQFAPQKFNSDISDTKTEAVLVIRHFTANVNKDSRSYVSES
jgi:hypothetical protein